MKVINTINTREINFEKDGTVLTLIGNNVIDYSSQPQGECSYFWVLLKNKEYFKYLFLNHWDDDDQLHEKLSQYFFNMLQTTGLTKSGDIVFMPQRITIDKFKSTHFTQSAH